MKCVFCPPKPSIMLRPAQSLHVFPKKGHTSHTKNRRVCPHLGISPPDVAILPVSLDSLDPGGSAPNSETQPPQSLSLADTKYPIIQANSDTNYLKLATGPQMNSSVLQNCPPLETHITSSGSPHYPHFYQTWLQRRISHLPSPGLYHLLEQLTEVRKALC